MNNVEFEEYKPLTQSYTPRGPGGNMAGRLVKMGIVKTEKGAEYLLIGVAILFFLISFYFFAKAF